MTRFPNGARVCFLGDSITAANVYTTYIAAAYYEQFPEAGIEFYNSGVSGAGAYTMHHRFEADCLSHDTTHATLMTGVNDAELWHLEQPHGANRYMALKRAALRYHDNMRLLCERILEKGISLTLLTPPPYAEYNEAPNEPWQGGAAVLTHYADYVHALGKEYGLPVVDVQAHLTLMNEIEPLFNPDRVHPNAKGQFEIARCVLASQGIDIGPFRELPVFIREWYETVLKERTIPWLERNVIPYCIKDDDKRIAFIRDYLENKRYPRDVFKDYSERYLEYKPQEEFLKREVIRLAKELAGTNNR